MTLIDCALKGIVSVNVSEIYKCLKLNDTQKAAFLVALTDKTKSCPVAADQLEDIGLNSDLNSFNELTHYIIAQTNADNKALSQKLTKSMYQPIDMIDITTSYCLCLHYHRFEIESEVVDQYQ